MTGVNNKLVVRRMAAVQAHTWQPETFQVPYGCIWDTGWSFWNKTIFPNDKSPSYRFLFNRYFCDQDESSDCDEDVCRLLYHCRLHKVLGWNSYENKHLGKMGISHLQNLLRLFIEGVADWTVWVCRQVEGEAGFIRVSFRYFELDFIWYWDCLGCN